MLAGPHEPQAGPAGEFCPFLAGQVKPHRMKEKQSGRGEASGLSLEPPPPAQPQPRKWGREEIRLNLLLEGMEKE